MQIYTLKVVNKCTPGATIEYNYMYVQWYRWLSAYLNMHKNRRVHRPQETTAETKLSYGAL